MSKYNTIPIETLHQLLICDPVAGTLTWRVRTPEMFTATPKRTREHMANNWNAQYAGKPALAYVSKIGYCSGAILGKGFLAHRVIFAMATGDWPTDQIDHEFGNRSYSPMSRIRDATHAQNGRNQKRHRDNTSGVTGVNWHKPTQKWLAQIMINYQQIYLGLFPAKDDAIAARKLAEVKYGFHPNHGRGE